MSIRTPNKKFKNIAFCFFDIPKISPRQQSYQVCCVHFTGVVGQRLRGSIFTWGDQVPDEALDVFVTTVMQQAVGKEGSADLFHVGLLQGALEATVSQDVAPPAPTKEGRKGEKEGTTPVSLWIHPATNK